MDIKYEILQLVKDSLANKTKLAKKLEVVFDVVDENQANRLLKYHPINLLGYKRVLDNSGINHAIKNHGNKSDLLRGLVPITHQDFTVIPEIVKAENIIMVSKNKKGALVLLYEYVDVDFFYYAEEVRTGRKKLALNTLYKRKPPKVRR